MSSTPKPKMILDPSTCVLVTCPRKAKINGYCKQDWDDLVATGWTLALPRKSKKTRRDKSSKARRVH